jgi:hypothetical protein
MGSGRSAPPRLSSEALQDRRGTDTSVSLTAAFSGSSCLDSGKVSSAIRKRSLTGIWWRGTISCA